MFAKIINYSVKIVQKYLPEPFIFAVLLTFVAFIAAIPVCKQTPFEVINNWGHGIWSLLAFSMQMALVLVCGSVLAEAPIVKKLLDKLASLPKTPPSAIALVTFVSSVACWINWGFGLIVGVIFAKQTAKKLSGVDYRLLIASAYSGFVVWHAGLSGSIPLTMATEGESLTKATNGILTQAIPISQTIFNPYNLTTVIIVIIAITIVNSLMHPKGNNVITVNSEIFENEAKDSEVAFLQSDSSKLTPAEKLENSPLLSIIISCLGLTYLVYHLFVKKGNFDLNSVILLFLFLGIILHKTPVNYIKSFSQSVSGAAGILLQFPFYAGIMGIITGVGESGVSLGGEISLACISISNRVTYPILTFLCAGVVNVFVPSGGGQWAVQAPIMFSAGQQLGVNPALTGIAIAWGDAWTNLIQPFWALPALAIAKLSAKDIMGFCLIDLLVTGIIICAGLIVWAV